MADGTQNGIPQRVLALRSMLSKNRTHRELDERFRYLLDRRRTELEAGVIAEARCIALIGASGSGKTTAAEHLFASQPDLVFHDPHGPRLDVASFQVPSPATLKFVGQTVLETLGFELKRDKSAQIIWSMAKGHLEARRTLFLHIDEAQDLMRHQTPRELNAVVSTLKSLLQHKSWPVGLILTGTAELKTLINHDPQLARRVYHPHLHGSTALQVSSGMAGALIVRAERPPLVGTDRQIVQPGDLDLLLRAPDGQPLAEKVLVLQQIQYARLDANGQIEVVPDGPDKGHYICKEGQVGGINQYGPQFGPGTWPNSGRYTSINGAVLGSLGQATVGSVERWRFIHAGVRDTINLQILHKTSDVSLDDVTRADGNWIDQNCGAPINFHVVAQDGLTMAAAQKRTQSVLQPGYRVDALVSFPQAGDYCIIDAATPPAGSVNQDEPDRRLLGVVSATGDATPAMAADDYLQNWLLAAAERNIPEDARQRVTDDLRDGLKLSAFVPHPDIQKDEVTGEQTLVFNIDTSQTPPVFEVNGQPYDPNRIDRQLVVGGVDEWTLTSDLASHPFHIHVNPFQIVSILDPDGKDGHSVHGRHLHGSAAGRGGQLHVPGHASADGHPRSHGRARRLGRGGEEHPAEAGGQPGAGRGRGELYRHSGLGNRAWARFPACQRLDQKADVGS